MTASEQGGEHVQLLLGAYVLQALPQDEERVVAAHLAACSSCLAEAAELAQVRRVLDRLDRRGVARLLDAAGQPPATAQPHAETPPPATARPRAATPSTPGSASAPGSPVAGRTRDSHRPGDSGDRASGNGPARPGRRRWRPSRTLVAAVLIALAVGVGIGAWIGAREPVDIRLAGAQTQSGVSVRVTVIGTPGGASVDAVVEGLTVGEPYRLFVIGDRGESQVAASWIAQDERHGVGGEVTLPVSRITAVTLAHADAALVTVRLSQR